MLDFLFTYGAYKVTSRNDNSGAGKYVLWFLAIIALGFLLLKGIVHISGNEDLYGIVGGLIVWGVKWIFKIFVFCFVIGLMIILLQMIGLFIIRLSDLLSPSKRKN